MSGGSSRIHLMDPFHRYRNRGPGRWLCPRCALGLLLTYPALLTILVPPSQTPPQSPPAPMPQNNGDGGIDSAVPSPLPQSGNQLPRLGAGENAKATPSGCCPGPQPLCHPNLLGLCQIYPHICKHTLGLLGAKTKPCQFPHLSSLPLSPASSQSLWGSTFLQPQGLGTCYSWLEHIPFFAHPLLCLFAFFVYSAQTPILWEALPEPWSNSALCFYALLGSTG